MDEVMDMPFVKPCPFCGQEAVVINSLPVPGNYAVCLNVDCNCFNRAYSIRYWNDRPIEDALLARAEKAEAMVDKLLQVGQGLFDSALSDLSDMEPFDEWRALVAEVNLQKMLKEDGTLLDYLESQKK